MQEVISYKAPSNSLLPLTLMALFASVVTYTVTTNTDGYISDVDPNVLIATQAAWALTLAVWLGGVVSAKIL